MYQEWSKVKKRLDNLMCDSLKERVKFQTANYRKAHDGVGRVFIMVDKKEVFNMCTLKAGVARYHKQVELVEEQSKLGVEFYRSDVWEEAEERIQAEGVFDQYEFFNAVEEYLNSSISISLQSPNIIIQILTFLDRRVGKRTLLKMEDRMKEAHEIIQYFYRLRCEAEGIRKGGMKNESNLE